MYLLVNHRSRYRYSMCLLVIRSNPRDTWENKAGNVAKKEGAGHLRVGMLDTFSRGATKTGSHDRLGIAQPRI